MRDGDEVEVVLTGCEFKRVGDKNTPMCELAAKVAEPHDDAGQELKIPIWLSEKAAGIARQQFKKAGFLIDDHPLAKLAAWIKRAERLVKVTIETREYNGNLYYQGVIEIDDRPKNAVPPDELDEMTGWLRNVKKRDGEPEKPKPGTSTGNRRVDAKDVGREAPRREPANFDDIPF